MSNQNSDFNKQTIRGIEPSGKDVIKGGYQVVTPNPPPDPKPSGSWGTAVPSNTPQGTSDQSIGPDNSSPAHKNK